MRDVLSLQATNVAIESILSIAGHSVDDLRVSLSDESISSCMLLKSWIKFM